MKLGEVQIGQIWRSNQTHDQWLVTKTYSDLFTAYAVLRKVGGSDSDVRRVKLQCSPQGQALGGYTRVDEGA